MRKGSVLTHAGEALFEGLLIALIVVGLIAGTAFAARGGGGGGGKGGRSVSGVTLAITMVTDADGSGTTTWGDTVRYDVSKVTAPSSGCWAAASPGTVTIQQQQHRRMRRNMQRRIVCIGRKVNTPMRAPSAPGSPSSAASTTVD